ncbi:hypothetical protein [Mesoflavibacter sp. CH_XMU1404-2]|uniref:hypothetical protein n=1 Tax=Mesoflavibacter sp. CH_XMU1404-2 TaxID=3107766 RepID=UPI003009EBA8
MAVYKHILASKQKQIDSYMQFIVSEPLTYSQKEKLEIEIQKLIKEKNQMLNSSLADLLQIQIYTIQAASWINKT